MNKPINNLTTGTIFIAIFGTDDYQTDYTLYKALQDIDIKELLKRFKDTLFYANTTESKIYDYTTPFIEWMISEQIVEKFSPLYEIHSSGVEEGKELYYFLKIS